MQQQVLGDRAGPYQRLVSMIEARFGIAPQSQRDRLLAFFGARSAWELGSLAERLANADSTDPAWQALIESMLVHETYFFRHPAQLGLLARHVLPALRGFARLQNRRLSVWCAGCATGEEAFTLACLLRDADCPASILATDLSVDSVAIARAGIYRRRPGLNSFRAMPEEGWRHFRPVPGEPDTWSVTEPIRQAVEFAVRNLVTPHPAGYTADLISCRNVLIYFSDAGLKQVEEAIIAASRPGTILLLGPAERLRHTNVFVPLNPGDTQILHWPPG